jgi:hypothetical protein
MNALTVKAFRRAGYDDVQPRVNVKTYGLWAEAGRKVKEGEKSIKVKSLRLFHINQTEALSKQEPAKHLAEREARKSADNDPKFSPIPEPVKPSVAHAEKAKGKMPTATAQQPAA